MRVFDGTRDAGNEVQKMRSALPNSVLKTGDLPDEEKQWRKKGQKVSFPMKCAILEVIESKKFFPQPNYRAVAMRHGLKPSSVRQAYSRWKRGLIDLGGAQSPEEHKVEVNVELQRTLNLVARGERLLNDRLQGVILKCEQAAAEGVYSTFYDLGAEKIVDSLRKLGSLRHMKEQGYLAILDALERKRKGDVPPEPKTVAGKTIDVSVQGANDLQKLEQAFIKPVPTHQPTSPE